MKFFLEDKQDKAQSLANIGSGDHQEKIGQIEAAIIVQAAIRGYQVVFTSYIYTISFGSYVHYQISKYSFELFSICTNY